MDTSTFLYGLAIVLVLVGLAGIILPALPGLPLVFAGLLLAAWVDGFAHVHWGWLILLGTLTLIASVVDFVAGAFGAQRVGASKWAVWGATIGTLVGLLLGPWGLLIGPFAGAVGGELLYRRRLSGNDAGEAVKIGFATWLGLLFGVLLKLALAFAMIALFALLWFI